jgi:uncharacterized protein YkwD
MRFVIPFAGILACACLACGAALAPQSNSAKLGEAAAFAAAAGALQMAQAAMEQHARNTAPITHAGGAVVTPNCDNEGQYPCMSVSASESQPMKPDPEPEMDADQARDYVLGYINGVRKLNAVGPVVRDDAVDSFAQDGSEQLSLDHKPNRHLAEHAGDLHALAAEIQGSPDGVRPGSLQDQIAEILLGMMREGPGGMHHDTLLRPDWRKLGVGIVTRGGRMYFTVDFTN